MTMDDDRQGLPGSAVDDDLVRRLRGLKWPEVPPDVKDRCWEQFRERIERQQDGLQEANFPSQNRPLRRSYK